MIACSTFLSAWALIAATIGLGERIRLQQLVEKTDYIVAGASHEDVHSTLGEPIARWAPWRGFLGIADRPARWVYGTRFCIDNIVVPDLPFPNPIPVHLRLFGAAHEDLVIEWTSDDHVARVVRPELDVPDEAAEVFEPFYVVHDLLSLFLFNERAVR